MCILLSTGLMHYVEQANVFKVQLLIKSEFLTFTVLLFPLFYNPFTYDLIFLSSKSIKSRISTQSCLPTQMSLTHAPYAPQFTTWLQLAVPSRSQPQASGMPAVVS